MILFRDGLEEEIDSAPIVTRNREGHTIESYTVNGTPRFFVTLNDSWYCAHGDTIASAISDAIWKDPSKRPSLESLKAEIVKAGKDRKISLNEFRVLTGACREGCLTAIKRAKVSGEPMTAEEIRDKVSVEWGSKLISILGF